MLSRASTAFTGLLTAIATTMFVGTVGTGGVDKAPTSARLANVELRNFTVDVSGIAAGGNITSRINAILAAYPSGVRVMIPPSSTGSWQANMDQIVLNSGQHLTALIPGTVKLVGVGSGDRLIFIQDNSLNTSITDLDFDGVTTEDYAVRIGAGAKFFTWQRSDVGKLCALRGGLISSDGSQNNDTSLWRYHIHLDRITGTAMAFGTYNESQAEFITMGFTRYWSVTNCVANGYHSGVYGQGGTAGTYTAVQAGTDGFGVRRCCNGLVSNSHFNGSGAGVWFSCAADILVMGCSANDIADVSFDVEAGDDITFFDCKGTNAGNSIGSVYFSSRNVRFIGCKFYFTNTTDLHRGDQNCFFRSWNVSNDPNRHYGLVIESCHFEAKVLCRNGTFPKIGDNNMDHVDPLKRDGGALRDPVIRNCTIINGRIDFKYANFWKVGITDNKFWYTLAQTATGTPPALVNVEGYGWNTGGSTSAADGYYTSEISRNRMEIHTAQQDGQVAFRLGSSAFAGNIKICVTLMDNQVIGENAIDNAFAVRHGMVNGSARFAIKAGGNKAPNAYRNSGKSLVIDDTGAARPTMWFNIGAQVGGTYNNVQFGGQISRSFGVKEILSVTTTTMTVKDATGIYAGDTITVAGLAAGADNGAKVVQAVNWNTGVITISGGGLTAATPAAGSATITPATKSIPAPGIGLQMITSVSATTYTVASTAGLAVGDTVGVVGLATAGNNGTKTITALTATTITVSGGLTAEASPPAGAHLIFARTNRVLIAQYTIGTSGNGYVEAGTGFVADGRMAYDAALAVESAAKLEAFVVGSGVLQVWAVNPTGVVINLPATTTMAIRANGELVV